MSLSERAKELVAELTNGTPKLGDLRKRAKEIKKDHDLAMELLLPEILPSCLIRLKAIWLMLNPKFNGR